MTQEKRWRSISTLDAPSGIEGERKIEGKLTRWKQENGRKSGEVEGKKADENKQKKQKNQQANKQTNKQTKKKINKQTNKLDTTQSNTSELIPASP